MKLAQVTTGFVVIASVGALLAAPAQAYQVVAFPDVDTAPMGGCALREAIETLRTDTEVDTCVLAGTPGNDEILLLQSAANYPILLAGTGEDLDASGDFDIQEDLTITGAGPDLSTIDGKAVDRVFDVKTGVNLTLRDLKVTGGKAPNGTANTGAGGERGGGIRATGSLTLDNVIVTGNTAGSGGSGANGNPGQGGGFGGEGGGIYAVGFLTITDSVISNNTAGSGGAGGSASGVCTTVTNGGAGGAGGGGGGLTAGNGAMITGSTITGNSSGIGGGGGCASTPGAGANGGSGGGILAVGLTLTDSVVSDNQTRNGGKAAQDFDSANGTGSGRGGDGGGIWASSATISGSTISGNITGAGNGNAPGTTTQTSPGSQGGDGGGAVLSGSGSIVDSTFSGNSTGNGATSTDNFAGQGGNGGGLAITDSDIFAGTGYTISRSTFNDNSTGPGGNSGTQPGDGGSGGAIFVGNTNTIRTVSISDSTFTGNHTGAGGNRTTAGGVGGNGGRGGALGIGNTTNATFAHLTVAANTTGDGGTTGAGGTPGARSAGGAIDVSSSFQASTATLRNSILSANVPATCAVSNATLTDGGHNLVFGTQCTDITAFSTADPLLAALADNGGPTQTMAIGDASPARDAVPSSGAGCTATDQRGTTRPQGTACDAGAFEIFVPPPPDTGGGSGGGGEQPPATGGEQPPVVNITLPTDTAPPVIKLLLRKQKLLKALKKGYFAFFSDNEVGPATADLFASGKDAKGTAAKRKRVAHGSLKITHSGKQKLVLKFTRKAKKAFKNRKKVTLQLVLTVKDNAGNATKKTAKVVLKR